MGYEDDLNLYAYVRNDPLNLSDPTGRRVALTGKDEPRAQLIETAARATGLPLSESKGMLVAGANAEATNLAGQHVLDAINSPDTIFLNAVSDSPGVLVDSFASGTVDVGDINSIAARDDRLAGALLTHVISEQRSYEAGATYDVAHAQATIDESAIMGAATRTGGGDYVAGGGLSVEYRNVKGEIVVSFEYKFDENLTPR